MTPSSATVHGPCIRGRWRDPFPMAPAPTLHLVHGVGMWPGVFGAVAAAVSGPVRVATRPGYRGGGSTAGGVAGAGGGLTRQVAALSVRLRREPGIVVGVSGGATIALALAMTAPGGLRGVVTHEPLVGPLEPTLHRRIVEGAAALAATPGPDEVEAFLAGLYGRDTWSALPHEARRWARRHAGVVAQEVGAFAAFAPSPADLAAIAVPHLTTVGSRSGPERHRVADLLVGLGGADRRVVDGAGHLVVAERPGDYAVLVARFATECRP